jgi:hypothetical protein
MCIYDCCGSFGKTKILNIVDMNFNSEIFDTKTLKMIKNIIPVLHKITSKFILTTGLIIACQITFSQTIVYDKEVIQDYKEFEKNNNGEYKESLDDFGILKNPHIDIYSVRPSEVEIYKRLNDDFDPQLHVWYHFDKIKKDIIGIRYNWGLYNPSFNPNKEKEYIKDLMKQETRFIKKYNEIKDELESSFGRPSQLKTIADNAETYTENMFWVIDKMIIKLLIRFDRKIIKIPGDFIINEYSIEVMITYK